MKRTTIFLDEQLERELQALAGRTRRPMAAVVREAVERYVVAEADAGRSRLGFIGVGRSGRTGTAARHEDLLWKERRAKTSPERPSRLHREVPSRRRPRRKG